jgi:p-aminobenzoyl-glutamate transporter AbgT
LLPECLDRYFIVAQAALVPPGLAWVYLHDGFLGALTFLLVVVGWFVVELVVRPVLLAAGVRLSNILKGSANDRHP